MLFITSRRVLLPYHYIVVVGGERWSIEGGTDTKKVRNGTVVKNEFSKKDTKASTRPNDDILHQRPHH